MHLPDLYNRTLAELQGGHQGTRKMKLLTQAMVYLSDIDADRGDYVRRCTVCTGYKATQLEQLMLASEIPEGPWQDITASYFTH